MSVTNNMHYQQDSCIRCDLSCVIEVVPLFCFFPHVNWATRVKWDTESEWKGWNGLHIHASLTYFRYEYFSCNNIIPLSYLLLLTQYAFTHWPPTQVNMHLIWQAVTCFSLLKCKHLSASEVSDPPTGSRTVQKQKKRCSYSKVPQDGTKTPHT